MNCVIFTGPTISCEEAHNIVEATYLPPVKQGDIMTAIFTYQPDVIGIVDGCNDDELPVWHKEILFALENDIIVYGSGGVGALRAVETERFGMIGVGTIFQRLKEHVVSSADDIMSAYEERDGRFYRTSEPLVNIEATFKSATKAGIIDLTFSAYLLQLSKKLYYKNRNFSRIFQHAETEGMSGEKLDRLRAYCIQNYCDLQKKDALSLLEAIKTTTLNKKIGSHYQRFIDPEDNVFLHVVKYRDREVIHQNNHAPLYAVGDYIALNHAEMDEVMVRAKNRYLAGYWADILRVECSEEEIAAEIRRFKTRYALQNERDFEEWLRQNDLIVEEFQRLMQENARMRKLHNALKIQLKQKNFTRILIDELILTNTYSKWAERASCNESFYAEHKTEFVEEYQNSTLADCIKKFLPGRRIEWDSIFMDIVFEAGFTPESLKAALIKTLLEKHALEKMAKNIVLDENGCSGEKN